MDINQRTLNAATRTFRRLAQPHVDAYNRSLDLEPAYLAEYSGHAMNDALDAKLESLLEIVGSAYGIPADVIGEESYVWGCREADHHNH